MTTQNTTRLLDTITAQNPLASYLQTALGFADEIAVRLGMIRGKKSDPSTLRGLKRALKFLYRMVKDHGYTDESQILNGEFLQRCLSELKSRYPASAHSTMIRYVDFWFRALFPDRYPLVSDDVLHRAMIESDSVDEAIDSLAAIDPLFVHRNRYQIRQSYCVMKQVLTRPRTPRRDSTPLR